MKKALEVMASTNLCVLSTLGSDGQPQSAVVGFSEDENGWLVIGTSNVSRKYRNILADPRVSIVIGWDDRRTVQYEGFIHETHGEEHEKYQALHIAKHPINAKFKDDPNEVYLLVKPTWVRHTDARTDPWIVEETEDFAV
jgi:pyridoxine/pyridoxamine 5'-phosphate oxidase